MDGLLLLSFLFASVFIIFGCCTLKFSQQPRSSRDKDICKSSSHMKRHGGDILCTNLKGTRVDIDASSSLQEKNSMNEIRKKLLTLSNKFLR